MRGLIATAVLVYFLSCYVGTSVALTPAGDNVAAQVKSDLIDLALPEYEKVNSTITSILDQISTCLVQIESQKNSCVASVQKKCEDRVTALQCGVVVDAGGNQCSDFPAICTLKETEEKARTAIVGGIKDVGKALEQVGKEIEKLAVKVGEGVVGAVNEVGKVAEKAGQAIADGVNKAVEGVKNLGENIVQEVGKIGENIGTGIVNVGEKIVKGVEDAGKKIVGGVKDLFDKLGKRRRRQAAEPTCAELSNDTSACSYYQSVCADCTAFGAPGSEVDVDALLRAVCGDAVADNFASLADLLLRLAGLEEMINTVVITQVAFDGSSFQNLNGGQFSKVETLYTVNDVLYQSNASQPVPVFNAALAGPIIANDIYTEWFGAAK